MSEIIQEHVPTCWVCNTYSGGHEWVYLVLTVILVNAKEPGVATCVPQPVAVAVSYDEVNALFLFNHVEFVVECHNNCYNVFWKLHFNSYVIY